MRLISITIVGMFVFSMKAIDKYIKDTH